MNMCMSQTIGEDGVFGHKVATNACMKMNVSTTVNVMFSLVSVCDGINTEAIPVKVTSSTGTMRLLIYSSICRGSRVMNEMDDYIIY